MKKYHKHLAKVITLGLLLSSGGVMPCAQAADYNSTDTLSTSSWGDTYDKISITMADSGKNCAGIYTYGRNNTTIANDVVKVMISDSGDAYGYNGIMAEGVSTFKADKGFDLTINSTGTNNASGEDEVWRFGLRVENQSKVELGADSAITINSDLAECYTNGVYLDGQTDYAGYEVAVTGKGLTVNANKDNANQQMNYASGVTMQDGSKMNLEGDLKLHIEAANEIDGIRIRDWSYGAAANTLQAQNLEIYAKTTDGRIKGINSEGAHDKLTIAGATNIKLEGQGNVAGILIQGSDADSGFGKTVIDVTSTTDSILDEWSSAHYVYGVSQFSAGTSFDSLAITANTNKAEFSGIELVADNGHGSMNINGDLQIKANTHTDLLYGIESTAEAQLDVAGKTVIDLSSDDTTTKMFGVYAQTGSQLNFKDDASITLATTPEGSHAKMNAVYSRTQAKITFDKGLIIKNANVGEGLMGEGGTIIVNQAGGSDVQIEGYILSRYINESPGSDVPVSGNVQVNFDTAQSFLKGNSYTDSVSTNNLKFTNSAYWDLQGNSSVSDLTVGKGSVINMAADSSSYNNLQVGNLNASNGKFVMNLGWADAGGSYSDQLIIDKTSASGTSTLELLSVGGMEAAAAQQTVLVKGAASDTDFVVDGPVYASGLYEYDVNLAAKANNGKYDWYIGSLGKTAINSVDVMESSNQVAYSAWIDSNGTLRQRLGELQSGSDNGVWVRMFGGKLGGDAFTNKYKTYQIGYDAKAGDWLIGAAYEYTDGSLNYNSGSGENKIGAVSLYGTLLGQDDSALDIVLKRGRIYGDMDIYGKYSDNGDYSTDATSFGLEYSKRFDAGNDVFVEPQLQLTYGRIDGYDYRSAKGVSVAYDDINSLIGRLGVVAGKEFKRGSAYVKASVLHEFSGDGAVTMLAANGESYKADKEYGDTWLELGLGGNVALGKNFQLYGDVERSFGGDVTKHWGANLGVQYSF